MDAIAADFRSRRNRISLTPLIDVVFILLMFFMLTSSFTREKQWQLNAPVSAEAAQEGNEIERLVLANSGALVRADDMGVALSDTELGLLALKGLPVVLQPKTEADVQTIVTAMTRLRKLGVERLALANIFSDEFRGEGGMR